MKKLIQKHQYLIGCAILFGSLAFSIYAAQASANLAAPKTISPKNGESVISPIQFQWEPVPGAASYSYELELYYSKEWQAGSVTPSLETQTSLELSAGEKSGDKMRWRVWATDAQGKDGKKSPWTEFTLEYTIYKVEAVEEIRIAPEAQEEETSPESEFSQEEFISGYKNIIANEKIWQKELQKLQLEKFGKKLPKKWKKLKKKRVYRGIEAEYYWMLYRFEIAKNYYKDENYERAYQLAKAAERSYFETVPSKLAEIEEETRLKQEEMASEKERQEAEAEGRRISEMYERQRAEAQVGRQKHLKTQCGTSLDCLIAAAELCVPRKISLTWWFPDQQVTSTLEIKEKTGDLCKMYFRNDRVKLGERVFDENAKGGLDDATVKAWEGLDGSCTFDQRVMWENGEPDSAHVLMDLKKEKEQAQVFDLMGFLHSTKINYPCEGNIFPSY